MITNDEMEKRLRIKIPELRRAATETIANGLDHESVMCGLAVLGLLEMIAELSNKVEHERT